MRVCARDAGELSCGRKERPSPSGSSEPRWRPTLYQTGSRHPCRLHLPVCSTICTKAETAGLLAPQGVNSGRRDRSGTRYDCQAASARRLVLCCRTKLRVEARRKRRACHPRRNCLHSYRNRSRQRTRRSRSLCYPRRPPAPTPKPIPAPVRFFVDLASSVPATASEAAVAASFDKSLAPNYSLPACTTDGHEIPAATGYTCVFLSILSDGVRSAPNTRSDFVLDLWKHLSASTGRSSPPPGAIVAPCVISGRRVMLVPADGLAAVAWLVCSISNRVPGFFHEGAVPVDATAAE